MSLAGIVLVILIGLVFGWPWALVSFVCLFALIAVTR